MKLSQKKRILRYLKAGRSITPLQALAMFGCMRLGARIYDLKRDGHNIMSNVVYRNNNKKYSQYSMEEE